MRLNKIQRIGVVLLSISLLFIFWGLLDSILVNRYIENYGERLESLSSPRFITREYLLSPDDSLFFSVDSRDTIPYSPSFTLMVNISDQVYLNISKSGARDGSSYYDFELVADEDLALELSLHLLEGDWEVIEILNSPQLIKPLLSGRILKPVFAGVGLFIGIVFIFLFNDF